jgi:hypothetical protein
MRNIPDHRAYFKKAPLLDLIKFIFINIKPKLGIIISISIIVTSVALIRLFYSLCNQFAFSIIDWIFLFFAIIGVIVSLYNINFHLLGRPDCRIENDPDAYDTISKLIDLTPIATNNRTGVEFVSRDINFDKWLRSNDIILKENNKAWTNLIESLRRVDDEVEKIIRTQFWIARNQSDPKQFSNEDKVCLFTTPYKGIKTILYFKGSYYASYVTNEFSTKRLRTIGSRPRSLRLGFDWFPVSDNQLKSLENSHMGNHIGISTIGFTKDKCLVFWRQNYHAMIAEQLLVCTGAGSLDLSDIDPNNSLKSTLANGMERELREESSKQGKEFYFDPVSETRITGFYRWVSRGGKPEFVGITKLVVDACELEANDAEVEEPDWICEHRFKYPASCPDELFSSIESILSSNQISVSAWMATKCLKEAIKEEPGAWQDFFEFEKFNQ